MAVSLFAHYIMTIILFFFFNDTATTEIYTLSLHDALPICTGLLHPQVATAEQAGRPEDEHDHQDQHPERDRKSTRLNSSHVSISYAVFCLKKKIKKETLRQHTKDQVYAPKEILAYTQK